MQCIQLTFNIVFKVNYARHDAKTVTTLGIGFVNAMMASAHGKIKYVPISCFDNFTWSTRKQRATAPMSHSGLSRSFSLGCECFQRV